MLTQDTATPDGGLYEAASAISWFDWTAIVLILVFLVLGAFKGVAWQAGRLAILVAAYAIAIALGPAVASSIGGWFVGTGDPDLPLHIARTGLFLGVLVVVGLVVWFAQRFLQARPLTASGRLFGAILGTVSGGLMVLALLTGVQMFFGQRTIAEAASDSRSSVVGRRALELAEQVLPDDLADGARSWRGLLRDPAVETAPQGADDAPGGSADPTDRPRQLAPGRTPTVPGDGR